MGDGWGGSMEAFRHQRSPGSDRFLGLFSSTPPDANGSLSSSSIGDELDEDDIFATAPEPEPEPEPDLIRRNARNPVGKVGPNSHLAQSPLAGAGGGRRQPERGFGILAALPQEEKNRHTFHHRKATATAAAASSPLSTSPSSSGARVIPSLPKPKAADFAISVPSGKIYHQSAPVNVPMVPPRARKVGWGEVEEVLEEKEDEDEMLPPHEIVARANGSPMTFSVLEGVGRTLKGRDLRQVRNAVFRKTGFLD